MKKFWQKLDGNKTIIGSNLIALIALLPIPEPYKTISLAGIGLITGIAFKSHVKKGYFKSNKGH